MIKIKTITIFCREYPPVQFGGIANTAKFLIDELKKEKKYKINLITLKNKKYKYLPDYEQIKNISIYRIYIRNKLLFWYKTMKFTNTNKEIMKNTDLIHVLNARDCPFIYTAGKPVITNINDYLPSMIPLNFFKKFGLGDEAKFLQYFYYNFDKLLDFISLKKSNHIIFNSLFMEKYLVKYYRLDNKETRMIYKGIVFRKFENKKLKKSIDFLFLANKFNIKGAKEFLYALAIVKKKYPNIKAVMVGKPSKFDINYYKMIKNLGLNNIVELKGSVPHEEVYDYYLKSKIYVLPSYSDALAQGILEASAAKIPVISTLVGGIPEEHASEGAILLEPKSVEPLAKAMIKLLRNKELRRKMGLKGYKRTKRIFDYKKMINEYIDVYKEYI